MPRPYVPINKIEQYLLNKKHPQGRGKAKFFSGCGFSLNDCNALRLALETHPSTAKLVSSEQRPEGDKKLVFECDFVVLQGQRPCIRTVWIEERDNQRLRLVTAYPFT